ncbi:hypothetical protein V8E36_005646 [Tilletia maclaganii]
MLLRAGAFMAVVLLGQAPFIAAAAHDSLKCEDGTNHCVYITKSSHSDDFHFRNASFSTFVKRGDRSYVFLYDEGDRINEDALLYKGNVIFWSFADHYNVLAPEKLNAQPTISARWKYAGGEASLYNPVVSYSKNDALLIHLN